MPQRKPGKQELDSSSADAEGKGKMASTSTELANSAQLTPALLEQLLTTTLRKEISELRTEFLAELRNSHTALRSTLDDHEDRISSIESALTEMSTSLQRSEAQCASLIKENRSLRLKVDDLENRSRRMNLRVIGIPEGSEEGRPTQFMSSFFTTLFGDGVLSRTPVIERAHRALTSKPPKDKPPRAMIVRFHHFQMKEEIARLARQKQGTLTFNDNPILIFQDLSADLSRRRGEFRDVKAQLYNAGVKFHHRYPCQLVVFLQEKEYSFEDPIAAATFFKDKVQTLNVSQIEEPAT